MSQGYPSGKRARHAFERGVRDGYQRKRRPNPYLNEWMIDLYARGVAEGLKGREPVPVVVKPAPPPKAQKRPQSRSGQRRYDPPQHRSFTNPPRRGGGWR